MHLPDRDLLDRGQREVDRAEHVAQHQLAALHPHPGPDRARVEHDPRRAAPRPAPTAGRRPCRRPTRRRTRATTSPPMTAMTVPPFGANFSTVVSPSSVPVARVIHGPPLGSVVPFQPMLGGMVATESDVETTPFRDLDVTRSDSSLRRFLHGLPGVDQVGAEQRAASLSTRSIKTTAKAYALDLAISMVDLTTLEGQDTDGQGALAGRQGHAPRPVRPDLPRHGGGLRLPRHGRHGEGRAGRQRRQGRRGRDGVPQRPGRDGRQARRHQGRRGRGRRRDRHGDRPGRVPVRPLPRGLRGDRPGPRGLRRTSAPPQGDPRDRRAADLRQRTPRVAGSAMLAGGHFIKTSTGKVAAGRDPAGHAGHAGGRPRLPRGDRHA